MQIQKVRIVSGAYELCPVSAVEESKDVLNNLRMQAGNMPDCRMVELILTELEHAGFRNLILITDRVYESMKNLEMYIAKGQKIITSVKRTWSEESKHGRMFICFVGLILASYVRHIWEENEYLRKNLDSTESILA